MFRNKAQGTTTTPILAQRLTGDRIAGQQDLESESPV